MASDGQMTKPLDVFVSYSHSDEALWDELKKHLAPLVREKVISVWHDRKIVPGSQWQDEIHERLNRADLILLLVSKDFLASDYCWEVELKTAIERHDKGQSIVIPIILRPADWQNGPFAHLQALPTDGVPVTSHRPHDKAFAQIAHQLRQTILEHAWRISEVSVEVEDSDDCSELADEQSVAVATVTETVDIELTLDRDFDSYSEHEQRKLLKAIQSLLETDAQVKVLKKRRGSVKLTVRLTPVQAERLLWAAEGGQLDDFDVVGATTLGRPVRVPDHPLPNAEEELAVHIEEAIERETGGGVRDLFVQIHRDTVFVWGRCSTFYVKQKAQHAAMSSSPSLKVVNRIKVG